MDEEQMKVIAEAASKAATAAVTAHTVKVGEDLGALKKSNEDLSAQVKTLNDELASGKTKIADLGDQLVKVSNAHKEVSMGDVGLTQKEMKKFTSPESKSKMYRGMATGNWDGADAEKEFCAETKKKAMVGSDGESGGYALASEILMPIMELVRDMNPFEKLKTLNVSPRKYGFEVPALSSGATAYWIGEGMTITPSQGKLKMLRLDPKKVAGLVPVSREMIYAAEPGLAAVVERDLASAITSKMVEGFLYGNGGGNTPVGILNQPGITKLETAATGDSLTRAFARTLRGKVPEKYISNSFAFVGNRNTFWDMVNTITTAAPDGSVTADENLLLRANLGADYVSTGHINSDKTKSTGHDLADLIYGAWEKFIIATWWGGFRMESTTEGANAFPDDCVVIKGVLPCNCAVRDTAAFAIAPFVKTTNS